VLDDVIAPIRVEDSIIVKNTGNKVCILVVLLSLSLSHTHTHTHTHIYIYCTMCGPENVKFDDMQSELVTTTSEKLQNLKEVSDIFIKLLIRPKKSEKFPV
jgi:hypothetical protein